MRILYVFRSLAYWGGIERILVDKMNCLVRMYGDEVYMVTADQGEHRVPYQLEDGVVIEDLGINFHHQYRYHGMKKLLVARAKNRLFSSRFSACLNQIKPDVIVCTTANYTDLDILVHLKGRIPLVVESHSIHNRIFGQRGLRNRYADYMYSKSLKQAEVIVALTEKDAACWKRHFPSIHVQAIPNLVNLNRDGKAALDNRRVIIVGRFDYQKRVQDALLIWERVVAIHPDWVLDIYGEGEMQASIKAMAARLKNVCVHPPTNHIFDCYRNSSVLISTSLFEPFGLVIPEAMSCGLPVVAFDCPYGPADIITDGKDGFLVPDRDIEAFAEKLCQLIEHPDLRIKMGQAGILSSRRFSPELIMPQWKALFTRLSSLA